MPPEENNRMDFLPNLSATRGVVPLASTITAPTIMVETSGGSELPALMKIA